jgi:HEAT repeat protein
MKLLPFMMVILAVISYFASKRKQNPSKSASKRLHNPSVMDNPAEAENALRHTDWRVREAAVRALGQSGDLNTLSSLAAALNDDDDDVREAARQSLEKFGPAAIPSLLDILRGGRFEARGLAAKSMGIIGDRRAVPGLIEALNDKSMWVRIPAAEALGAIRDSQAVSSLITALDDDEIEVRKAAAAALNHIGTPEARKALKSHTHT